MAPTSTWAWASASMPCGLNGSELHQEQPEVELADIERVRRQRDGEQ
jgi:hypothetical protein